MDALPPFVRAERDALLAEIGAAFDGVSREGGVSWSQAADIDCYRGWMEDTGSDTSWQSLVDDPDWNPGPGVGGFTFLDAIGFRYYLPARMTQCVRDGTDESDSPIAWHLGRANSGPSDSKWSLLDLRQRRCVKRFLQYMDLIDPYFGSYDGASHWWDALDSYWKDVPDTDEPTRP